MRRLIINATGSGRVAVTADPVRTRVRESYVASRWVQRPINDRREADT